MVKVQHNTGNKLTAGKPHPRVVVAGERREMQNEIVMLLAKEPLTHRQRQVTALLSVGHTLEEIAQEIGTTQPTVHAHLRGAYSRLQLHGMHELVSYVLLKVMRHVKRIERSAADR